MSSLRRHEGYLLIDHRNSPGVPDALILASGKEMPLEANRGLYETATVTCAHCHAIVILNPQRERPRHYCPKCDHYVCDTPGCAVECRPFKQLLDQQQEQAFRQLGKG